MLGGPRTINFCAELCASWCTLQHIVLPSPRKESIGMCCNYKKTRMFLPTAGERGGGGQAQRVLVGGRFVHCMLSKGCLFYAHTHQPNKRIRESTDTQGVLVATFPIQTLACSLVDDCSVTLSGQLPLCSSYTAWRAHSNMPPSLSSVYREADNARYDPDGVLHRQRRNGRVDVAVRNKRASTDPPSSRAPPPAPDRRRGRGTSPSPPRAR